MIGKATTGENTHLDKKLLGALPAVKKVLELGRANSPLGNAYLERYPEAQWMRVDVDLNAIKSLEGFFDLLVLSNGLPPKELLETASAKVSKNSPLFASIENAATWRKLEQLLVGDVDSSEAPVSIASAYKHLLDAGWLPNLIDQHHAAPPSKVLTNAMEQMAEANGVPRQTAHLNLNMDRAVIHAVRGFDDTKRKPGPAEFCVVVPTTRESQL